LKKLPRAVCADGTMKGLFAYHAASTGRYSSRGGFNTQNLPRGTFETPEEYYAVINAIGRASLSDLVSILRSVFRFEMTSVDYSQIETRVILWMAGDEFGLEEFREKLDPYKTMASRIYRVPYDEVTKPQRQIGKSAVLGAGYQLGWRGYIAYCDKQDIVVDQEQAEHVISTFRAKYSRVTTAWKNFQTAAVRAIQRPGTPYHTNRCTLQVEGGYLWLTLPSGRSIAYKDPVLKPGREDWMGPEITFMGRDRYSRKWSRQSTYGGSVFQSAVQGTARDLMTHGMLRAHRAGIDLRGTVHDEVIAMGRVLKQLSRIMCELPEWARGLPVTADGWEGVFYRK
ncbi:MAG: DNA polymerase, partial [Halioglobus sp.]